MVGSGAAYLLEAEGMGKMEMEIAVVGTEPVAGKTGYWVETFIKDPKYGEGVAKFLFVPDQKTLQIKRTIMQGPNQPPAEVPADVFQFSDEEPPATDIREEAKLVGTERVTTPAGAFVCQHYQTSGKKAKPEDEDVAGARDASEVEDIWLSEKVAPYGLVKMSTKSSQLTLQRLITNAKTRIQGAPQR